MGLAAALLSATVGGWLGFHATADLLAVFTTIAGAAATANLALIPVSVARERALPTRPARHRTLVGAGAV